MTTLPPDLQAELADLCDVREAARRFVDECRAGDACGSRGVAP